MASSSQNSIRWLHLTDLHVGQDDQDWLWPRLKQKFKEDLEKTYKDAGPWDLVLFTGDLVQKGDEYSKLDKILEDIWNWFSEKELKCDPFPWLLAVPGNHDLLRPDTSQPEVFAIEQWQNNATVADHFWNNRDNNKWRKVVSDAFTSYDNWWENTTLRPREGINPGMMPGDFSFTFEKNGYLLGFVGLNSSFLQLTDKRDYEKRLVLDPRQFQAACRGNGVAWADKHHACILLTHHPLEWLSKKSQDDLNAEVMESFCLHLCGHNHQTEVTQIFRSGTDRAPIQWTGRSVFGLEKIDNNGGLSRQHGYAAGELRFSSNEKGELQFMPRRASKIENGHWSFIADNEAVELPCDNCKTKLFSINLTSKQPASPPPTSSDENTTYTKAINERLISNLDDYFAALPSKHKALHDTVVSGLKKAKVRKTAQSGSEPIEITEETKLIDIAKQSDSRELLEATIRWLNKESSLADINTQEIKMVITHLLILGVVKSAAEWIEQNQRFRANGRVIVEKDLDPQGAAVILAGLLDIAHWLARIDLKNPRGYIPINSDVAGNSDDVQERLKELKRYIANILNTSPTKVPQILSGFLNSEEPFYCLLGAEDALIQAIFNDRDDNTSLKGVLMILEQSSGQEPVIKQLPRLIKDIERLFDMVDTKTRQNR
ncbi:MAG: metallophosphoesterase [Deltaproteobacteria bacterium]|nr:metallophosphoesterase [Deltaproteobacteria bacterium]